MARRRQHQDVVCTDKITSGISPIATGQTARGHTTKPLRRSRFLSGSALAKWLKAEAKRIGFSDAKITNPNAISASQLHLQDWLKKGFHGDMQWMEARSEQRANPKELWHETNSILMVAYNYGPHEDPLANLNNPQKATISVYARNKDYHDILKSKLKLLAHAFIAKAGGDVKIFTDTAPVMEKPLAQAAGLGWQGKHTVLVSRDFGSWLFLGALFTTAKMPMDKPQKQLCGNCTKCLTICPTNAFPKPFSLDATRCIAYLTNEHKDPIPFEFRQAMGNRIYGCDDCLAVCPWNKFAKQTHEIMLISREDLIAPNLQDFLKMDDAQFRTHFSRSPIKRIGRARFLRNVLIAVGNGKLIECLHDIEQLLLEEHPLIRGAAVWALAKVVDQNNLQEYAKNALENEQEQSVILEWKHALGV